jgi:hypothetical protein
MQALTGFPASLARLCTGQALSLSNEIIVGCWGRADAIPHRLLPPPMHRDSVLGRIPVELVQELFCLPVLMIGECLCFPGLAAL